jgi:hypothetical protein
MDFFDFVYDVTDDLMMRGSVEVRERRDVDKLHNLVASIY